MLLAIHKINIDNLKLQTFRKIGTLIMQYSYAIYGIIK